MNDCLLGNMSAGGKRENSKTLFYKDYSLASVKPLRQLVLSELLTSKYNKKTTRHHLCTYVK